MSDPHVRLERQGPLARLILARPAVRNAMSAPMGAEVCQAVAELNGDASLRAVLVCGEGRAFAAGGDFDFLEARAASTPEHNRRVMRDYYDLFLAITKVHVPTIAVLHGAAIGAGLCFALACDLRLAAPGVKLGLNFVRLGLHPGMGATWLLPRIVGPSMAKQLLFTGRVIEAEEALRIGMVDALHPAEQLVAAAEALATEIAEAAPLAVARLKANLGWAAAGTLDEALDAEASAQALDYATDDFGEGLAALRERRAPRFSGR